jgi:hypothetical protein
MDTIFSFQAPTGNSTISLRLEAETQSAPANTIILHLTFSQPEEVSVRIHVETSTGKITIANVASLAGPTVACLGACAVAGVMGPLIECFNKDVAKYLECLSSKGVSVGADIVKCIIGCAGGALGGALGPAGTAHA